MSNVVSGQLTVGMDIDKPVGARLSFLDRFLPVWIIMAMAAGIGLGRAIPSLGTHLNAIQVTSGTSLPIFIGLLIMMYPVLAKVRYGQLGSVTRDRRMLVSSLVLNWIIGPALMFTLAWLLLPDQPAYRTGLIIVGLARCIAMVLIWNDLSGGDREAAAVLVAINSLFQIVAFALLGYFYLRVLPGWLGLSTIGLHLSIWKIAETVAIFLGVPLVAGFLTRTLAERAKGRQWYENELLPRLSPFALYGLLYTIVILFALQGRTITSHPVDVARIALPLLGLLRHHVVRIVCLGTGDRPALRTNSHPRLHRRRQQFRTGHRRGYRCVRSDQRTSPCRGRRPPHRSPGPRRPGLRVPLGPTALLLLANGADMTDNQIPEVLFVCVHNAGRSQMAAGLLDHHAAGRVKVRSAGSTPADTLNPAVVAAMAEIGLDISHHHPKPLTAEAGRAADVIVTMGCGDACPVYPGKRYLDWELPDPAGQPLEVVRAIRADIERRVQALIDELTGK